MMTKTIVVDWDSLVDLARTFNQVKSRYLDLKRIDAGIPSKRERQRRIFAACQCIWSTDISAIYADKHFDATPRYCVYAHLDPTHRVAVSKNAITTFAATLGMDCWPFYIGKGTDDRCYDLNRNETHRKVRQWITALGKEPTITIIASGLTECEALQREAKLIDIFGLITSGGYLTNLDEGECSNERRRLYDKAFTALRKINQATRVNAGGRE